MHAAQSPDQLRAWAGIWLGCRSSIIISDYHWLWPIVATIYEILEVMLRLFDAFFVWLRLLRFLASPTARRCLLRFGAQLCLIWRQAKPGLGLFHTAHTRHIQVNAYTCNYLASGRRWATATTMTVISYSILWCDSLCFCCNCSCCSCCCRCFCICFIFSTLRQYPVICLCKLLTRPREAHTQRETHKFSCLFGALIAKTNCLPAKIHAQQQVPVSMAITIPIPIPIPVLGLSSSCT